VGQHLLEKDGQMEEVIGVVGFSLGASLGMGLIRALGTGLRPVLKGVIKVGLTATDTAQSAASSAGDAMSTARDRMRHEATQTDDPAQPVEPHGQSTPQKIVIART